jgi:hypothetical protein
MNTEAYSMALGLLRTVSASLQITGVVPPIAGKIVDRGVLLLSQSLAALSEYDDLVEEIKALNESGQPLTDESVRQVYANIRASSRAIQDWEDPDAPK